MPRSILVELMYRVSLKIEDIWKEFCSNKMITVTKKEDILIKDTTLIISGGGINNKLLIRDINQKSNFTSIIKSNDIGINSDIKEAFLMCVMGMGRFINLETNIPNVTGASQSVLCGDIYG